MYAFIATIGVGFIVIFVIFALYTIISAAIQAARYSTTEETLLFIGTVGGTILAAYFLGRVANYLITIY